MHKGKKAFTLIEAIAVAAVILVLAAVLMPNLKRLKAKTTLVRCAANLRTIYGGWAGYMTERNGVIVPTFNNGATWESTLHYSTLPNPNMANRPNITTFYQCPANPCRNGLVWRGPNYAYSPSMGEVRDDPNQFSAPPYYRYLYTYGMIPSPAKTLLITDASQLGTNPAATDPRWNCMLTFGWENFDGTDKSEQERRIGYKWHDGLANFLFADGHVEALNPLAAKQRYDERSLIVNPW
jgi:prepilin-type processing-associated H-X9-DG protein